MQEAVVVTSLRTGLAKSFRGSLNLARSDDLAAHCIQSVMRAVPQLDPREVEDVILGCAQPHGVQGQNIARIAAMLAGLPVTTAATTVNRFCSSGLQSIAMAAHEIIHEGADAAIAGGVESISLTPRDSQPNTKLQEQLPGIYMAMGITAEVVAKQYKISREAQDEYSLASQQRTARAQQEGFFAHEIAPMKVTMAVLDKKTG
jgi:acetyl-CoA C-acetyltransferase